MASAPRTRSIARVAARVKSEGDAIAGIVGKRLGSAATADVAAAIADAKAAVGTRDSFQNFGLNLGMGTDNALSGSTYGFNPITRIRTLLEWIYRGSWLGGVAVDVIADDMTRAGIEFGSVLDPEAGQDLHAALEESGVWEGINDTIKWGRLYGGAIGVLLIDGQDMSKPLRLNAIGRDAFKGIMVLDRWMVEPILTDLVTDMGPSLGLPKYYRVTTDAPAFPSTKIHYSRCIRFEGDRLPYWQRLMENLWGLSVFERLYDRLVAFDSATQGAAQSVYKSYLRTYKIMGMREMIATGGEAEAILTRFVEMMRRFQGIEGITLIDGNDDFIVQSPSNMTGIAEALVQFGQQLSGALQIPLVRLFGQSPAGLNSTGESDLATYDDGIAHRQKRQLKRPLGIVLTVQAASAGIKLPDNFTWNFAPLRQMTDEQKADTAGKVATAVSTVEGTIIGRATALKELKQSSQRTGIFTNITDEEIKAAEDEPAPGPESQEFQAELAAEQPGPGGEAPAPGADPAPGGPGGPAGGRAAGAPPDRLNGAAGADDVHVHLVNDARAPLDRAFGLPITVEFRKGERRYGVKSPAHYGFIDDTDSAEPGECMDCFIGPLDDSRTAYVIDQHRDGRFDEHKVMLGYPDAAAAMRDWTAMYANDAKMRAGACHTVRMPALKRWLARGDVTKPFAHPRPRLVGRTGDDGEWREALHPRDPDGKFSEGGGGDVRTNIAKGLYEKHTKADLAQPAERERVAHELIASKGPEAVARVQSARDKLKSLNGFSTDMPVDQGGYLQPDGRYTPERRQHHAKLIAEVFSPEAVARATPKPGEKPVMTILGGRGGSGKSWITNPGKGGPVDPSGTIVIDADHFKSRLPEYEGWNAAMLHEESSHLVELASKIARKKGLNVAHDETLKSGNKAPNRISDFAKAGYEVEGFYMFAPPEVAASRALDRFLGKQTGGRFVPPEIVLGNTNNEANFDEVIPYLRRWGIYDNSGARPTTVSEGSRHERASA